MDEFKLYPCCKLTASSVVGVQDYTADKPLILIVDDDEDNLLLMAYMLEHTYCSTLTAVDGLSALSIAQAFEPDLILLDILMPSMDGVEVVSHIRKDSRIKSIPVIAVTALALAGERERLLLAGFNDYVSKPFMLEEIEATIQRHLRLPATIS
jgi:two-component system, cell cycle response regulator DivK